MKDRGSYEGTEKASRGLESEPEYDGTGTADAVAASWERGFWVLAGDTWTNV